MLTTKHINHFKELTGLAKHVSKKKAKANCSLTVYKLIQFTKCYFIRSTAVKILSLISSSYTTDCCYKALFKI